LNATYWADILARITPYVPENVDDITSGFDARIRKGAQAGTGVMAIGHEICKDMPFQTEQMGAIGFRITQERADITQVALHLANLAMEHEVEVVVLNHLDYCGLERFGFRCERITGQTDAERDACEEEIRRFWGIDLVL
jgi:hypothetical protein